MKWERATTVIRLLCLACGIAAFGVARHLLQMCKAGIEDVPPPFILLPGLAGAVFLLVAVVGRYPWRNHS